jgi:hypothetical protein
VGAVHASMVPSTNAVASATQAWCTAVVAARLACTAARLPRLHGPTAWSVCQTVPGAGSSSATSALQRNHA